MASVDAAKLSSQIETDAAASLPAVASAASPLLPEPLAHAHPLRIGADDACGTTPASAGSSDGGGAATLPAYGSLSSGTFSDAAMLIERGVTTSYCLLVLQVRQKPSAALFFNVPELSTLVCRAMSAATAGTMESSLTRAHGTCSLTVLSWCAIVDGGLGAPVRALSRRLLQAPGKAPAAYAPDFSAYAVSPHVRCLRITREGVRLSGRGAVHPHLMSRLHAPFKMSRSTASSPRPMSRHRPTAHVRGLTQ